MMGVLFAQSYYDGDDPREKEIRQIADTLYKKVDWPWLQQRAPLISMGWFPESGFIDHDWMGYNEAMMVYILAWVRPRIRSARTRGRCGRAPTTTTGVSTRARNTCPSARCSATSTATSGSTSATSRTRTCERGSTYFLNSRSAALAQREYAIANPMQWKDYGENVWGLTASDGPQNTTQEYRGEQRQFRHYSRAAPACARTSMTAPSPPPPRSHRWCSHPSR